MTSGGMRAACVAALTAVLCAPRASEAEFGATQSHDVRNELDLGAAREFLAAYCLRCHGPAERKGGHDFTLLEDPSLRGTLASTWEEIAEQLSLGAMPPEDARRPEPDEARAIATWIRASLSGTSAGEPAPRSRLRRLNAFEYRNTIRDLLLIDTTLFDPTRSFPPDESNAGFDNVGEALVTSGFLLDRYLAAASGAVARALYTGPRPEQHALTFAPPFMKWGGGLLPEVARTRTDRFEDLYTRPTALEGYLVPDTLSEGVPSAGEYLIRVRASAVGRLHPYASLETRRDEPLRMGIVAASRRDGHLRGCSPSEVVLAEFELADDEVREYQCRAWLEESYVPRITFPNGPDVTPMIAFFNLEPEHHPELVGKHDGRAWKDDVERLHTLAAEFLEVYVGPRVRVHQIEVVGPSFDAWPPASQVAILGEGVETPNPDDVLLRFARRAFRRPVERGDIAAILALVERLDARGESSLEQIRAGVQAILCAPDFLYLVEGEGLLDAHALATRLSYFFWSTMPDEQLFRAAEAGTLREPETLRTEAERMLRDAKAQAFVAHFTDRWLGLHRIGAMPPDPERYAEYYRDELERSIASESHAFFAHLLELDLDVGLFLDSDFTFVDAALARLYGISGVQGRELRRAPLPDARRGGLLGQASVLTVTANGIDTSPVARGVWVLENLLGKPPPPPPPVVESLEPDTRGSVGIRDQLAAHRDRKTCNACHREIDPLGFPLENYDPIGRWRATYEVSGRAVDAAGLTADGAELRHVGELKRYLLERKEQFARCLTEKLVTYATGAPVRPEDEAEIRAIVEQLAERGYGLRTLVLLVVQSELFARK